MKKFQLTIIFILLITIISLPFTAYADEGDFVKIENDSVGFYRLVDDTMTLQFYLPADTYALVVFDDGGSYYLVKYNNISGYIKKSEVATGLYSDINDPYSTTVITLNSPKLVYPAVNSNSPFTLATDDILTYLGKITDGVNWYAVKKNTDTGFYFVKESDVYVEPTVEPNPNNNDDDTTPETENSLVKTLLIVGIIIPAIIIVFLLFKPKRRRTHSPRYMDDNPRRRYEDDYYYNDDDYYDE